ncbi:MAG: hypothetical protein WCK28_22450 [Burkholderiales bacterium]|jgi:hypothetical protein
MDTRPDDFPDTRPFAWTTSAWRGPITNGRAGAAADAVSPALSERAARTVEALRRDGIDAGPLALRSPQTLNRLAEHWEAPERVLELLSGMFADRYDTARRTPDDAFSALLAVQRHTVRRIVAAAGLPPGPPRTGLSPGTCRPS